MMNRPALLIFFICISARAETCFRYEVQGVTIPKNDGASFIVNKGTMSESIFSVPLKELHIFSSHLNTTATGIFIFKHPPQSKDEIFRIESLNSSIPDPLHPMKNSFIKFKGKTKC